jgi:hypothetical protein
MGSELDKNAVELVDDSSNVKEARPTDATQLENAVGYREYLEAANIEGSDKEVDLHAVQVLRRPAET